MSLKVVVMGGRSSYTPEIIEGMIRRHDSFPVTDIVLVDIAAGREKLAVAWLCSLLLIFVCAFIHAYEANFLLKIFYLQLPLQIMCGNSCVSICEIVA